MKYNIVTNTAGRPNHNPSLALAMKALQPGQHFFANVEDQISVHSFKRSLTKVFTTKTIKNGKTSKLKVTCTAAY